MGLVDYDYSDDDEQEKQEEKEGEKEKIMRKRRKLKNTDDDEATFTVPIDYSVLQDNDEEDKPTQEKKEPKNSTPSSSGAGICSFLPAPKNAPAVTSSSANATSRISLAPKTLTNNSLAAKAPQESLRSANAFASAKDVTPVNPVQIPQSKTSDSSFQKSPQQHHHHQQQQQQQQYVKYDTFTDFNSSDAAAYSYSESNAYSNDVDVSAMVPANERRRARKLGKQIENEMMGNFVEIRADLLHESIDVVNAPPIPNQSSSLPVGVNKATRLQKSRNQINHLAAHYQANHAHLLDQQAKMAQTKREVRSKYGKMFGCCSKRGKGTGKGAIKPPNEYLSLVSLGKFDAERRSDGKINSITFMNDGHIDIDYGDKVDNKFVTKWHHITEKTNNIKSGMLTLNDGTKLTIEEIPKESELGHWIMKLNGSTFHAFTQEYGQAKKYADWSSEPTGAKSNVMEEDAKDAGLDLAANNNAPKLIQEENRKNVFDDSSSDESETNPPDDGQDSTKHSLEMRSEEIGDSVKPQEVKLEPPVSTMEMLDKRRDTVTEEDEELLKAVQSENADHANYEENRSSCRLSREMNGDAKRAPIFSSNPTMAMALMRRASIVIGDPEDILNQQNDGIQNENETTIQNAETVGRETRDSNEAAAQSNQIDENVQSSLDLVAADKYKIQSDKTSHVSSDVESNDIKTASELSGVSEAILQDKLEPSPNNIASADNSELQTSFSESHQDSNVTVPQDNDADTQQQNNDTKNDAQIILVSSSDSQQEINSCQELAVKNSPELDNDTPLNQNQEFIAPETVTKVFSLECSNENDALSEVTEVGSITTSASESDGFSESDWQDSDVDAKSSDAAAQDEDIYAPDSVVPAQDSHVSDQDSHIDTQDSNIITHDSNIDTRDSNIDTQEGIEETDLKQEILPSNDEDLIILEKVENQTYSLTETNSDNLSRTSSSSSSDSESVSSSSDTSDSSEDSKDSDSETQANVNPVTTIVANHATKNDDSDSDSDSESESSLSSESSDQNRNSEIESESETDSDSDDSTSE